MTDPAGIFPSNTHRRVLGHLSTPDSDYGWHPDALVQRMRQDQSTWFETAEQILPYLKDLEQFGDAQLHAHGWQMTAYGFARLTGPARQLEGAPAGPAVIAPAPEPKKRRFRRSKG